MGKNKEIKTKPVKTKQVKTKPAKKNSKASVNSARAITSKIPYITCFEECGMIQIENNKYSITYKIEPPNVLSDERYVSSIAYAKMENILNSLKDYDFRFTIRNSYVPVDEYLKTIELPMDKDEKLNSFIEDYNATLRENVGIGHNNFKMSLFLTVITTADNAEEALDKLKNVDGFVVNNVKELYQYNAKLLTLDERLEVLYDIYHPDADSPKFGSKVDWDGNGFSISSMKRMKMSTKDVISPIFYEAKERNYMCVGNKFIRMFFINSVPTQVTDSLLSDIISISSNSILSVNYQPIDVSYGFDASARLVKNNTEVRNVVVRDTIKDRKNKRIDKKESYINETEIEYFNKKALDNFTEAKAKDEPIYLTSFVIGLYSDTLEELERDTGLLRISTNKYNCQIKVCDLQQHEAFVSVLPLGSMAVDISRVFPIERLSKLLPVNIQSLFEKKITLQGLNEINDNFVLVDRENYPVGLIAGMKNSGKTFAMKREILNTLMSTNDYVVVVNKNKYVTNKETKKPELVASDYEGLINALDTSVYDAFNTDLFTCDESYGLTTPNSNFKQMFIESFIMFRLGLHKKATMTENEMDILKKELEKEAKALCEYSVFEDAVSFAKANPDDFKLFISSLTNFVPTTEYPDLTDKRFNVINYNTVTELLMTIDYLWNVAIAMKKANINLWIYIDGIDDFIYSSNTSDYLISLLDKCEKIKVPFTMIIEDSARIVSNNNAKIEFDYFLEKIDYFKLLTQGVIERRKYVEKLAIPQSLVPYITDREFSEGIIITPSSNISFNDKFDTESNKFYERLK